MVENPDTWGQVEKIIFKVISDFNEDPAFRFGKSLPGRIADALREARLLREEGDNDNGELGPTP